MSNRTLNLGLIGAGWSRSMYREAFKRNPRIALAAAADPDATALIRLREDFPACQAFDTVDSMFAGVKLDAVIIASPPFYHLDHIRSAAKAGVAILLEKPMARTLAEAQLMVDVCREAKVKLAVAFNRRFLPPLATATDMVKAGELGTVFHVDVIWTSWSAHASCGWRDSPETLGGVFQDHGAHTIDLCRQWLGPTKSVSASAARVGPSLGIDRQVEDHLTALIHHEQGSSMHVHSRASHRPVSEFYRIYGTKGTLELEYTGDWAFLATDSWDIRLYEQGNPVPKRLIAKRPNNELLNEIPDGAFSYYLELKHFTEEIRTGQSGQCPTGEEALDVVADVCACYVSAASGISVQVNQAAAWDVDTMRKIKRI